MPRGQVTQTILDGALGVVNVPQNSVLPIIGNSASGPTAQPLAYSGSAGKRAMTQLFGTEGRLPQLASLVLDGGGQAVVIKTPDTNAGSATAVTATAGNTSTSVVTTSGTPLDDYLVKFLVVKGGTRGTAGITFKWSKDAGRTYSAETPLGTATTYVLTGTGITLNFAAGTLVAGDTFTFGCTGPKWAAADVTAALAALQASAFTWAGPIMLAGDMAEGDAATFEANLETMASSGYKFACIIGNAIDASPPAAYGGSGQSEAAWMTSIENSWSPASFVRIGVSGGHYNIISGIDGTRFRRPLSWSIGKRRAQVPAFEMTGKVATGALPSFAVDTVNDPVDGFVYHNEDAVQGLDAARFMTARVIPGRPGYYCLIDNLMAPPGSDFSFLPRRLTMDKLCALNHDANEEFIGSSVRIDPATGYTLEEDLQAIERAVLAKLKLLVASGDFSSVSYTLSRTDNILSTNTLTYTTRGVALGYAFSIDGTIGFLNPALAA